MDRRYAPKRGRCVVLRVGPSAFCKDPASVDGSSAGTSDQGDVPGVEVGGGTSHAP